MSLRYKNKVLFGENVSEGTVKVILFELFGIIDEFFYEDGDEIAYWEQSGGFEEAIFINLSKKYENVLIIVKSAKMEDFRFSLSDIRIHWFMNGEHLFSNTQILPLISRKEVKDFKINALKNHQCHFDRFVSSDNKNVVVACHCGNQATYKRSEGDK